MYWVVVPTLVSGGIMPPLTNEFPKLADIGVHSSPTLHYWSATVPGTAISMRVRMTATPMVRNIL